MITTTKAVCYVIRPELWEDRGDPHYPNREEAAKDLIEAYEDAQTDASPRWVVQLSHARVIPHDVPCAMVVCDTCGDTLENDEIGGTLHLQPVDADADVLALLDVMDWTWDGHGRHHCDTCERLHDTEVPTPAPYDIPLFELEELS